MVDQQNDTGSKMWCLPLTKPFRSWSQVFSSQGFESEQHVALVVSWFDSVFFVFIFCFVQFSSMV